MRHFIQPGKDIAATLRFISENEHGQPAVLALKAANSSLIDVNFAVNQIQGRQLAQKKLPLWHSTPGIVYPPHISMEQCSSQFTAAYKAGLVVGDSFTDLTGGFGVDFSFMARNAKRATYVERNPELCRIAGHNLPLLGLQHASVHCCDATEFAGDMTFSDIANLGIASPMSIVSSGVQQTNSTVPLRQIAKVGPKWSESRILHRGGERCITVTAQFIQGVFTAPVEKEIARIMQEEIELPQGVRSEVGGEIEYGDEALPQIYGGIIIAMIIVFFFLLFNFKKYGITTICMVALALMTPGALIGLGLMNRALGLTSIFGLITLMGMIMRNEILIFEHAIDLINKYVAEHGDWTVDRKAYNEAVRQAAYDAGKRRMVPIFLTTATTAVGVVPMIIAQSSFWMPVGVTIFAGGIGSLIMVVTMLPVIYWKVSTK